MKKSRRQALGQHFLANRSVLLRIVGIIDPSAADTVIEIGAGKGALTIALAERAGLVVAVEKDGRLIPALTQAVPGNVRVVHADVLTLDLRGLVEGLGISAARMAGNLPYSITTPFLFRLLGAKDRVADGVFLVQKEVAERITAGPATKKFAPLSILIQNDFEAGIAGTVSPGSFSPPPKVQSAILSLRKRESPLHAEAGSDAFRTFLRMGFAQRRKKLKNNLAAVAPHAVLGRAFETAGISPDARAEELSADRLVALFRALEPRRRAG